MSQEATPRINAAMMREFNGRPVLLVGKVLNVSGSETTLESSDQGRVKVYTNPVL